MIDTETQEELDYLYALGATENMLRALALDDDHDNLVVCATPFASLQENMAQAISVPVEFGGNTVTFSIRKALSEDSWWLTEEGSVNNVDVNSVQRFVLGTYKHRRNNWTYMLVSPYEYKEDTPNMLKRQCIANCSLLIKY